EEHLGSDKGAGHHRKGADDEGRAGVARSRREFASAPDAESRPARNQARDQKGGGEDPRREGPGSPRRQLPGQDEAAAGAPRDGTTTRLEESLRNAEIG